MICRVSLHDMVKRSEVDNVTLENKKLVQLAPWLVVRWGKKSQTPTFASTQALGYYSYIYVERHTFRHMLQATIICRYKSWLPLAGTYFSDFFQN